MLKGAWNWFIGLSSKTRALILVSFVVLGIGSSLSDSYEDSVSGDAVTTATPSATPAPTASATAQATVTPSASPSPETPLEFRFSALRDLDDLRKDVNDARKGITQEGLGKFYWNMVEVQFNLSQLESLRPRDAYAQDWNAKLLSLSAAVGDIDTDDENLTISSAKSKLDKILRALPPLEKIAKSLAN